VHVKNPFRSEAEAYRFLIGTVVYFVAIAVATALGGRWVGLAVFVVLSVLVLVWFFRRETQERLPASAPLAHAGDEQRILVVANETVGGAELRDAIRTAAGERRAGVLVVSPALNSKIRHWASDEDGARAAAEERLGRSVAALEELGFAAAGEVGDADPVQAIEDALRTFRPDVIIISTHPEGRSNWLERGVVSTARERFAVPIEHVVVDLNAART
jgi:membrane protein implicated in regulation of membrane protease activity